MPKIKLPTKSPRIDMTPMVDTFAVILTFLMLTATMRQTEPANVATPFSISEKPTPDFNNMTFLISPEGKVYLNMDNGPDTLYKFRRKILEEMGKRYSIVFTEKELREFEKFPSSMGVPIAKMKEFLAGKNMKERDPFQVGIPVDSTDNQLAMWILCARQVNPAINASIKGDANTPFPKVKDVLDNLQDKKINRFMLVTSLEATKIDLEEIKQ
jgi:biopolymer transport protein ExbD